MKVRGKFPVTRLRRNRRERWIRDLVAENTLSSSDLILPIFITYGVNKSEPITSMPGVNRYSLDLLEPIIESAVDHRLPAVAIFPEIKPENKTIDAKEAYNPDNIVCEAIRKIKNMNKDLGIICDAALDPFNADGHDGLVLGGKIDNDLTVELLCKQSIVQAEAGCDIIAPSDMMDGRVGAIRAALDEKNYEDVAIMSYAAKFSSNFYSPFRDAIGSKTLLKSDKHTYQLNPANISESIREVGFDIDEGADMLLIKPGLPYLDVLAKIKETYGLPTFSYQVSGEYSMLKAAINNGWLDNDMSIIETLISFKRAGADGIITYLALEAASLIENSH